MAIELKEYVGAVALQTKSSDNKINLTEGYTQTYVDDESLIHSGVYNVSFLVMIE